MWKVGGLKIVTAASRRIILPGWHRNWWKSAFFYKTLRTRKFSRGKFFEGSTHGILTHSRFRICVLKGSATHFCLCYSCPKSGEGGKTRFASKNKEALKVITRLPEFFLSQILVREVSKLHFESSLARIWHKKFSGGRVIFFNAAPQLFFFSLNKGELQPAVTWL